MGMPGATLTDILSKKESLRLSELEGVLAKNLHGAFQVGRALTEIRDSRLYRENHTTFEEYCREVWDLGRPRAYQLIDCSEVYDLLSTTVDKKISSIGDILPVNEAQTRPLVPLSSEKQIEVWTLVVETATSANGKITANLVQQCVNTLKRAKIAKIIEKAKGTGTTKKATISKEMRGALQVFMDALQHETRTNLKNSVRQDLANHLRLILEEIENQ